jgi:hypothetical protein
MNPERLVCRTDVAAWFLTPHHLVSICAYSTGQGMWGMPMEAKDVTREELEYMFPPLEILEQWHAGRDAAWPPALEDDDDAALPNVALRFPVGTPVSCRVGPEEWAPGTIVQLWYSEPNWPPGSYAPYKVRLDDGRNIFAPADLDQVIKARGPVSNAADMDQPQNDDAMKNKDFRNRFASNKALQQQQPDTAIE